MTSSNVRIESLGVHLPEKILTTEALLASCRHRPHCDFERITGIRERRVADGEFASDLAIGAARRALAMSRFRPEDLDAVVCTSISRHNRPAEFDLEPAAAVVIRRAIGANRAIVFDVVNACAGMLSGIYVLQGLIRSGAIRCGMVVSGEQNMPLAETAAREIRHRLDPQMASLTLGDCGAAVIIEASPDPAVGFHRLDLVTGAKHDHFCHSRPSSKGPGGVLVTNPRGLQRKGAEHFPAYLKAALDATGWTVADLHHVIPHQVSVRAIRQGIKTVERFLGCALPDYFLTCVDRYGNTTTTSHFLAMHEFILDGTIRSGENLLLVSGASGIVISHATLTLDDLPDRYRACAKKGEGS